MREITVIRKKQFRAALMPFWIVSEAFQQQYLSGAEHRAESARISFFGQPKAAIDFGLLMKNAVGIRGGETVTVMLPEEERAVYACTADGILSNAAFLPPDVEQITLRLTVRGGLWTPAYPWFEN